MGFFVCGDNRFVYDASAYGRTMLLEHLIVLFDDLFWDYDRMSESGQKTLDRLSRMYALKYEESNAKGARDALFK